MSLDNYPFEKFTEIGQFKNVVRAVKDRARYVGRDENNEPIYDSNKQLPTLEFKGTEKLHGCFAADSLVTLANGNKKKIAEIQNGDTILSYDVNGKQFAPSLVEKIFKNKSNKEWIKLLFDNGTIIKCTKDHKIFTKNRGWIEAKDLSENDTFLTTKEELLKMKLISKESIRREMCYDLQIKNTNCFFVNNILVHNSNAGVLITRDYKIRCQSRERIIKPGDDNYGFAQFIHSLPEEVIYSLWHIGDPDCHASWDVTIYGEWCGRGIQQKVAICEVDKFWTIFAARTFIGENEKYNGWVDISQLNFTELNNHRIFGTNQNTTWQIQIDFNNEVDLAEKTNLMNEWVMNVEKESPFAKNNFGIFGIGEGIVFQGWTPGYTDSKFTFKVKGSEHSKSHVKKLATVDVEKVKSLQEFVDKHVSEERLQQGVNYLKEIKLFDFENPLKSLGDFIRFVVNDILKEESDELSLNFTENDKKKLNSLVVVAAKNWYFKQNN